MLQTLKHFFIPHEGNNYHPHILHTKRAILYSGVFLIMKLIVVVFVLLLPLQVFVMPDVLLQEQQQVIAYTNELRQEQGLPPLVTHTKLYTSSQFKAEDMATKGYFEHEGPDGRKLQDWLSQVHYDYLVAGENLAMGFSDARELVDAWIQSPTHYANLVDPEYGEFGVGIEMGEFNGVPTVYVAQHFGTQVKENEPGEFIQPESEVASSPIESIDVVTGTSTVFDSDTEVVMTTTTVADTIVRTTDLLVTALKQEESKSDLEAPRASSSTLARLVYHPVVSRVFWKDDGQDKTELLARAYIVGDVAQAIVRINHYTIELFPTGKPFIYEGRLAIFESSDSLFKVVVMPSISIQDSQGDIYQDTILWNTIKQVSPTPYEKYTHAKNSLGFLTSIFDISQNLYIGFIIFFSIALILKIFIEIRKQHPHVIVQTILLLGLLVVLFEV